MNSAAVPADDLHGVSSTAAQRAAGERSKRTGCALPRADPLRPRLRVRWLRRARPAPQGPLGGHCDARAGFGGGVRGGVALEAAGVDALRDRGEAEEREREAEAPGGAGIAPGAARVRGDDLRLARDARAPRVAAAFEARADHVEDAVVREVREWMAERRELPVEDGDDARLARVEDQVPEPVVAVHEGRLVVRRHVAREPGQERG